MNHNRAGSNTVRAILAGEWPTSEPADGRIKGGLTYALSQFRNAPIDVRGNSLTVAGYSFKGCYISYPNNSELIGTQYSESVHLTQEP